MDFQDLRFLQSFTTRMHGSAFQTKRPYILLWYGISVVNYTLLQ